MLPTGKNSILAIYYFPTADLSDGDYKLDLTYFKTYMIPNVNSSNNKFYFDKDKKEIVIPVRTAYIDKYLKGAFSNDIMRKRMFYKDEDDESEHPLIIRANNNTMKSKINYLLDKFLTISKSHNIGSLPGFLSKCVQEQWHELNVLIKIINVNIIHTATTDTHNT